LLLKLLHAKLVLRERFDKLLKLFSVAFRQIGFEFSRLRSQLRIIILESGETFVVRLLVGVGLLWRHSLKRIVFDKNSKKSFFHFFSGGTKCFARIVVSRTSKPKHEQSKVYELFFLRIVTNGGTNGRL
jgi:hypothetical protein